MLAAVVGALSVTAVVGPFLVTRLARGVSRLDGLDWTVPVGDAGVARLTIMSGRADGTGLHLAWSPSPRLTLSAGAFRAPDAHWLAHASIVTAHQESHAQRGALHGVTLDLAARDLLLHRIASDEPTRNLSARAMLARAVALFRGASLAEPRDRLSAALREALLHGTTHARNWLNGVLHAVLGENVPRAPFAAAFRVVSIC